VGDALISRNIDDSRFFSPRTVQAWERFLPAAVLLGGLAITLSLWFWSSNRTREELEIEFNLVSKQISTQIERRLFSQEVVLHAASGLFSASDSVSREEFKTFIDSLQLADHYPGVQGVGYARKIPPGELEQHIAAVRKEGFPNYTVKPEGAREDYSSIIYLEPFDWRNQRAFGYDMYSEPTRREAMMRARDTGQPAMSGKITLVQETKDKVQPGFLIYQPVYANGQPHETQEDRRTHLLGWVYSPFRMYDLMQRTSDRYSPELNIKIYDTAEVHPDHLLFDSLTAYQGALRPMFQQQIKLTPAGHTWTVIISSLPPFELKGDWNEDRVIAALGTALSLIFSLLTWLLVNGRAQLSRLLIEAEERSNIDFLTRAYNRRYFMDASERELARSDRHQLPLSLAFIDLDNFKKLNDIQGHKRGDDLLILIVRTLQDNLRENDILARMGGDEFVLLLPQTNQEQARQMMDRLIGILKPAITPFNSEVSCSVGVVTKAPEVTLTVDELLMAADRVMYSIKRSTKDAIEYALITAQDAKTDTAPAGSPAVFQ